MSKPIRISFVDFWFDFDPENNFIRDTLESFVPTEIVRRNPDLLFYSVFGTKNLGFMGKKVLINGEIHSQNYGRPDFSISYHESTNSSRLRLPIWAWHSQPGLLVPSSQRFPTAGNHFCNFTYSNPNCEFRNRFFLALDRMKSVDSLGAAFRSDTPRFLLDSRNSSKWRDSKTSMLSNYRFTISFENVSEPGYSTEKLVDAFLAGSIPIYWGDPFVAEDFNIRSFVNLHNYQNYLEAIDAILELERDPQLMGAMRSEAPMSETQYSRYFNGQFETFLKYAIESSGHSKRHKLIHSTWGRLTRLGQPSSRNPVAALARRVLR